MAVWIDWLDKLKDPRRSPYERRYRLLSLMTSIVILLAVGAERDPEKVCRMNVEHAVEAIRHAFRDHPEIPSANLEIRGAIYDIRTGKVDWI